MATPLKQSPLTPSSLQSPFSPHVHSLSGENEDYKLYRSIMDGIGNEFTKPEGLEEISQTLGVRQTNPRNRVSILIFGNHSAGKSSFINWYVGQKIQAESMAMETSGFTFVTSGKKRASFRGAATLRHFPFIKGIENFTGVQEYLATEVVPSSKRNFPFVDLIDTPGLTDGKLQYAFDVNAILCWLADRVDLVFVFFDPHGQAMVERTMDVVKLVKQVNNPEKIHYFLTKADSIATEAERLKVLSQLSQNLSAAAREVSNQRYYGQHALEVKTIYRPNEPEPTFGCNGNNNTSSDDSDGLVIHSALSPPPKTPTSTTSSSSSASSMSRTPSLISSSTHDINHEKKDFNQIDELVQLVDKTVKQNVQKHCETLEKTVVILRDRIDEELVKHEQLTVRNQRAAMLRWTLLITAWTLPIFLLSYILHFIETIFFSKVKAPWAAPFLITIHVLASVAELFDSSDHRYTILASVMIVFILFLIGARLLTLVQVPLKSDKEINKYQVWRDTLQQMLDKRSGCVNMYWDRFLAGSVEVE